MNSRTTRSFREAFMVLPPDVRERAKQAYRLWRDNPQLPGLRFKRVGDEVSVRNGPQYLGRAGILDRVTYTTSYGIENVPSLAVAEPFPRKNYVDKRVVQEGHVITAKGRAFGDFAFAIFDYLDIYAGRQAEKERLYADIMDR